MRGPEWMRNGALLRLLISGFGVRVPDGAPTPFLSALRPGVTGSVGTPAGRRATPTAAGVLALHRQLSHHRREPGVVEVLECELFAQQPGGRSTTRREAKLAVVDYLQSFYT